MDQRAHPRSDRISAIPVHMRPLVPHSRMLYFFHGMRMVILGQALTKEGAIPDAEIERTITRKDIFARHPARHSYEEEVPNGEDERGVENS
ncbi:MAG: hypothetical protein HOP18_27195 [Deltaproteobacteria bacterium]|nr:hypothetical protein [Deltaproteobacteria bacterium]